MVGVWVRVICRPEDGMSGRILQTTPSRFATALRALQSRTPVLRARPYLLAGRLAFAYGRNHRP